MGKIITKKDECVFLILTHFMSQNERPEVYRLHEHTEEETGLIRLTGMDTGM